MFIFAILCIIAAVSAKEYETHAGGPSFSIEIVNRGGQLEFNTTVAKGKYLGLIFYKQPDFFQDMI